MPRTNGRINLKIEQVGFLTARFGFGFKKPSVTFFNFIAIHRFVVGAVTYRIMGQKCHIKNRKIYSK